jgi:ABC-2 type transport system ATP-binding protein
LRETVAALRDSGKTILLTTHYMYEADELCGRVAVINGGRIVAEGTPASLKAAIADRTTIEVRAKGLTEGVLTRIRELSGVSSVVVEEGEDSQTLLVQSSLGAELVQPLVGLLDQVAVTAVSAREPTLEDAYVALVEST